MDLKKILEKNNISFTKQREIIFNEIKNLHHFTYEDLEKKLKNIWRASIFRTLKLFHDIGIIKIIDTSSWAIIYELDNTASHHEHMKCKKCHTIYEFDDRELHELFEKISEKKNFKLQNHSLLLEGICKNCNNS